MPVPSLRQKPASCLSLRRQRLCHGLCRHGRRCASGCARRAGQIGAPPVGLKPNYFPPVGLKPNYFPPVGLKPNYFPDRRPAV
ncbi:hypothetical protein [Kamptonema formosum]|uniref:hypothetical protein n=1 Tax=Kamptonema formosum TaxID=331992 RepID=UPI00034688BA|nr:hypothetical protein [Oscillatoria sp. PCC 10802]